MAQDNLPVFEDEAEGETSRMVQSPSDMSQKPESRDFWPPRKARSGSYGRGYPNGSAGRVTRGRQKSIGEAIEIIRTRRGSVSANAQELAEALRAPVSFRLIVGIRLYEAMPY
jgi:solute carrier family 35, member E1